jgi:dephospho-CoA kinase
MKIIGLTGGIGMGKSTVAAAFRRAGIPVFDADAAVHALQGPGGRALPAISAAFPGTVAPGADGRPTLDRAALRRAVLSDPVALRQLERIIHPLVRAEEHAFLGRARAARRRAAVLDIPLLLETGGQTRVDFVIVVSAPKNVQIGRVRRRGRMSVEQIEAVIARQMPDREKRLHADLFVRTGLSRNHALRAVRRLIASLLA